MPHSTGLWLNLTLKITFALSVDEVVGIDFGEVFDSKVINAQGEFYFEGEVEPQAS